MKPEDGRRTTEDRFKSVSFTYQIRFKWVKYGSFIAHTMSDKIDVHSRPQTGLGN